MTLYPSRLRHLSNATQTMIETVTLKVTFLKIRIKRDQEHILMAPQNLRRKSLTLLMIKDPQSTRELIQQSEKLRRK